MDQPVMMGIDEAGRGPVLGPMVYACSFSPVETDKKLKEIGFADSKALTEDQREKLLAKMHDPACITPIGYIINILSPHFITTRMLAKYKISLNVISQDSAVSLIEKVIESGVKLTEVYVDTVGRPERYQAYLLEKFPHLSITVESKADSTFGIVSAASICAKVTRDRCLAAWSYIEKRDFSSFPLGSGYPGDPVTKKFLQSALHELFGFPQLVRSSWSTAYIIMDKLCLPVKWEDDNVEDEVKPSRKRKSISDTHSQSMFSFVKVTQSENSKIKQRFQFFQDRKLERVESIF